MLNKTQIHFYKENGYLIVDNVFPQEDLNLIQNSFNIILDSIIKRAKIEYPEHKQSLEKINNNELSEKMSALECISHKYIAEFHDLMLTTNNPYVAKLVSSEGVLNFANSLLGEKHHNPLFMTSSQGIFSMPNNKKHTVIQWHTDVFYTCKDGQYVHFWAPIIEDSSKALGSIHILPGSHKNPFQGEIRGNSNNKSDIHKFRISDDFVKKYNDTVIEIKQGQGLFFDQQKVRHSCLISSH